MFNVKQRTAICFDKVSLRKNKDGIKTAKMRFAVRLEGDVILHCPAEVRAAYEAIETRDNLISYVELDKVINGVNVEFYPFPDSKSCSLVLNAASLDKLAVERKEGERNEPHLLFTIEVILEERDKLRYWLMDNCFNQLWANFEIAQLSLTPSIADEIANFTKPSGLTAQELCPFPDCKLYADHEGDHVLKTATITEKAKRGRKLQPVEVQ